MKRLCKAKRINQNVQNGKALQRKVIGFAAAN
jgi:hypothetical protein